MSARDSSTETVLLRTAPDPILELEAILQTAPLKMSRQDRL